MEVAAVFQASDANGLKQNKKQSEQNIKYLRGKTTACDQAMKYRKRRECPASVSG